MNKVVALTVFVLLLVLLSCDNNIVDGFVVRLSAHTQTQPTTTRVSLMLTRLSTRSAPDVPTVNSLKASSGFIPASPKGPRKQTPATTLQTLHIQTNTETVPSTKSSSPQTQPPQHPVNYSVGLMFCPDYSRAIIDQGTRSAASHPQAKQLFDTASAILKFDLLKACDECAGVGKNSVN
jgi:hypothetical protein